MGSHSSKCSEYSVKKDTFENSLQWIPGQVFTVITDWERTSFGDTTGQRMRTIVQANSVRY